MKSTYHLITGIIGFILLLSCSEKENSNDSYKACFDILSDTMKVGEQITFSNCSENAGTYSWNFGDGHISRLETPNHTYTVAGTYQIILFAGDDKNNDGLLNDMDDADSAIQTLVIVHNKKSFELTIKDGTSWTITNPDLTIVSGATAELYREYNSVESHNPDYSLISDTDGKAVFYDLSEGTYYLVVFKEDLSNLKDGYLIAGVFQTQEEVDSWAIQSDAHVGGLRYYDTNDDFLITPSDKTNSAPINYNGEDPIVSEITIGK